MQQHTVHQAHHDLFKLFLRPFPRTRGGGRAPLSLAAAGEG